MGCAVLAMLERYGKEAYSSINLDYDVLSYYEGNKRRAEMLSPDKVSEAPREPVTQPTRTANTGEMSAGSRET